MTKDETKVCHCDKCNDDPDFLFKFNGKNLCIQCLAETIPHITFHCEKCGKEVTDSDYIFEYKSKAICLDCVLNDLETIEN